MCGRERSKSIFFSECGSVDAQQGKKQRERARRCGATNYDLDIFCDYWRRSFLGPSVVKAVCEEEGETFSFEKNFHDSRREEEEQKPDN
jgi:hypothetical protein